MNGELKKKKPVEYKCIMNKVEDVYEKSRMKYKIKNDEINKTFYIMFKTEEGKVKNIKKIYAKCGKEEQ